MKNILLKPYPLTIPRNFNIIFLYSIGIGFFIFMFLLIFQPFGLSYFENESKTLILLGYGIITAIVSFLIEFILPNIFKSFFNDIKWKVINEAIFLLITVIIIGISNFFYSIIVIDSIEFSFASFINFIIITLLIGVFPVIFSVFISYVIYLKRNIGISNEINLILKSNYIGKKQLADTPQLNSTESFTLVSDNGNEKVELELEQLLYLKAEGNYVNICSFDNNKLSNKLLRTTLKNIGINFQDSDYIKQCHRAYFVNISKVTDITGNSQGLKLFLNNSDIYVPVSRPYINKMKAVLSNLK